jgi:beta-glucanase (GH16 family)
MKMKSFVLVMSIIASAVGAVSCGNDSDETDRSYELVWEDDFEGAAGTLPDASKWTYDIGTGENGWGNQELQYYTNQPENVSMDGEGNLVITAIDEPFQGSTYTSARIKTQGLFAQTYGKFEARIKTPFGQGLWPAFWMLGGDITSVGWPQCGEIDILELRGQQPTIVHGSIHGPGYSGGNAITASYSKENVRFDTDFHVFTVEWGVDFIDFFVDGQLFQQITPANLPPGAEWVYDHDFFLILNVAVGGAFVGSVSPTTPFPQTMIIDYVRVYQ